MTREDAVTTLKDISEMVHKQKEIEKSTLYGILDSNNEPIEALDMAIKALEQEPCEDCISREEVCDYIAEFVNHEYATDRERELVKNIIDGIQHLPSIQPTAKGNLVVEDCISREFIEIIVNYPPANLCTYPEYKGKPYYSILYRGEDGRNHVGFGTYKIEMLSQWIKQYFMSDNQPKSKTGHWISKHIVDDCNGVVTWYECSECGRCVDDPITEEFMLKDYPYCHCGAKMIPTDSEKE